MGLRIILLKEDQAFLLVRWRKTGINVKEYNNSIYQNIKLEFIGQIPMLDWTNVYSARMVYRHEYTRAGSQKSVLSLWLLWQPVYTKRKSIVLFFFISIFPFWSTNDFFLIRFRFTYFILCAQMLCLHVYTFTICIPGVLRDQRGIKSDHQELVWRMALNHHIGAEMEPGSSKRLARALNFWAFSPSL